jgi:septal ring factor EnvC (AmiA/AmiB activator)
LRNLNEAQIKWYMNSPAASAAVKAAFAKALDMQAKIAETQTQIATVQKELNVVTTDNARVRENLKIIPQTSEFYKPMLEKFVNQDKQIETQQTQVRTLTATMQTQMRDYDLFLSKLDAE